MDFKERIWIAINLMKEKKYKPTVFINMINDHGEVEAVRRLINNPQASYGFEKLWRMNALHLSLEAIILEEEWIELFSEDERVRARRKLNQCGYKK
ncbi:MAG: hypothetical protein FWG77_07385 [Treponema sp.]|nr:hypothetical protein [Treponema sp.]